MPSKRADIGPREIEEARAAAVGRTYTSGDPLVIADGLERGLSLRVQGGAASWVLKFNGKSRSLGRLGELRTAKAAREVAARVRGMLRDGTDPSDYLKSRLAGSAHETAAAKVEIAKARAAGRWTFADLARSYCDEYLSNPRMTSRGIVKPPSPSTAAEARRYLGIAEAAGLQGRLLSELSPGDLEDVRNACERAGRKTASRQFVAYAKAALTYARRKQSRLAGLEGVRPWWLEVEKLDSTIPAPRSRHPSVAELARVLWTAETVRTMPGRETARRTSESVLCSLWWIALTAQRSGAGLSLRKAHVLPWKDGPPGWRVVFWPNVAMKGKRPHALPVPPRTVLLIERAVAAAARPGSDFVFPSVRTTGRASDTPMTKSSPGGLISRLRGRPADVEEESAEEVEAQLGVDLLEGIGHFSPHDLRRTFATTLGDLAVRGDAVSAVLDHTQEHGTAGRFAPATTAADITRLAYDYSQRLELKRIAVEAWTNALFAACDAEWGKHRPPRGFPGSNRRNCFAEMGALVQRGESAAVRREAEEAERIRRERAARGPINLAALRASAWQDDEDDGSERHEDV